METDNTKRLLKFALFTSTAIGVITVGPFYALSMALGNMSQNMLIFIIAISVLGVSFLVFSFWAFNIFFFRFLDRKKLLVKKEFARILLSFVIPLVALHSLKLIASYFFLDNDLTEKILSWKIREFGLDDNSVLVTHFRNPVFSNVVLTFVVISVNSVILIVYRMLRLNYRKIKIEKENNELRIKNIEAHNQALVGQLRPHFLFNSLSTLKSLIKKDPENAEKYLMKLSEFLRFSVSFRDNVVIKVSEELKLCSGYLEMQKMRFGESLTYSVNIHEHLYDLFIPVFALQMLAENAIKHNSFSDSAPLHIEIQSEGNSITVSNNLKPKHKSEESTGTGLANLSERYGVISGDTVQINTTEKQFIVTIKAIEHENSDHRR